ncbi:MAG: ergothioneine biosynthesis protein EgtB [Acidobacteria bacterium]|nr:ergothioneine biosynthesis protein EgtB [Acidobacteriota bacterium]
MRSAELIEMLRDARRRTLDLVSDLTDRQMEVPLLPIINPPIWEMGHVAWFWERWALRHLRGEEPVRPWGDAVWDSAAVAHDTRWRPDAPSRVETWNYMQEVLDRVIERLPAGEVSDQEAYFYWLATMHEDMHDEAFTYTRQTLGYAAPLGTVETPRRGDARTRGHGDVEVPGGTWMLGAMPGTVFVFDNEKWEHPVEVRPFRIARWPVTNGEFGDFVNDGGYRRREWWSEEGWTWREQERSEHPLYWVPRGNGGWMRRHFDQVVPLGEDIPVIHVNWYEAEAYCRWVGRRLPTEAEWEMAAAGGPGGKREFPWGEKPPTPERAHLDARSVGCSPLGSVPAGASAFGCQEMIGNTWEWTADDFQPYPGFVIDPYKEYSQPWFGPERKVLRGGCWATRSRLIRNTWRNFYTKDRRDVFGGFRTCAAD